MNGRSLSGQGIRHYVVHSRDIYCPKVDLVVLAPFEKLYGLGAQGPAAGALLLVDV